MPDVEWHSVDPAPIVLIQGPEQLLAQRAVERLKERCRAADPDLAVHELTPDGGGTMSLSAVASPSLFGENRLILVPELQSAPDALFAELDEYLKAPESDVTLVLVHRSGNRGKRTLDALKKAQVPRVDCQALKKPAQTQTFVAAEFAREGRRILPEAAAALVEAFGSDLAELAATARQLLRDTEPEDQSARPGPVTVQDVHALTAGRVETTAFAVADATVSGRAAEALALLRRAELAGTDPVPLVATIAMKLRQIAKAAAPGASARSLGMPDWMFRNAVRDARAWDDRSLARAFEAVAHADLEVKGAGRDPHWSVQRMITEVCRARARR